MGCVTISRAGSFYRVACDPVEALPLSFVPGETGSAVVDMTQKEGRHD